MSNKEKCVAMLDDLTEDQIDLVIHWLKELKADRDTPNAETLAAMKETEKMARNGTGLPWSGSTKDYFAAILAEED